MSQSAAPPVMARSKIIDEVASLGVLAVPTALSTIATGFLGTVDATAAGRLGVAELGALGLGNIVFFVVICIGIGLMLGLDPLVTQAIGANDILRARRWLDSGVRLALILSPALVAVLLLAPSFLVFAGATSPSVGAEVRDYLLGRAPGVPPFLLFIALRGYLQARRMSFVVIAALAVVIANLVNAPLVYLLGLGGEAFGPSIGVLRAVPRLGLLGIGIGSTIALMVKAILMFGALRFLDPAPKGSAKGSNADVMEIARLGVPIGLQLLLEVGSFSIGMFVASSLSAESGAAFQAMMAVAQLTFSAPLGLGAAAAVRVGRGIGERDPDAARRSGAVAFVVTAVVMAAIGTALFLYRAPIARLFTDDRATLVIAERLLLITAVFQVVDGLQACAAGALRGAADTVVPFVANFVGHYVIGLPIALALTYALGWRADGVLWGLAAGLGAVAVFLCMRFFRLPRRSFEPVERTGAPAVPA